MVPTYHLDSQVYTEIITDGKRVTPRNVFSEYSEVKISEAGPPIISGHTGLEVTASTVQGDFTYA
jgi:hypothetical protein